MFAFLVWFSGLIKYLTLFMLRILEFQGFPFLNFAFK